MTIDEISVQKQKLVETGNVSWTLTKIKLTEYSLDHMHSKV